MKLHVIFDKNGDKIGDLDSMEYALSKLNKVENTNNELQITVANGLVIYAFRVLVKEKKLNYKNLLLYNKSTDPNLEHPIKVDKNGDQKEYPIGMLDEYSNILCKLL